MNLTPGKYNCVRPKCHILITPSSSSSNETSLSAFLMIDLHPGDHGSESDTTQTVKFSGDLRIDGRVVTFDWKIVEDVSSSAEDNNKDNNSSRRIKVNRSSGMIMPEGDGVLNTGALPHESQGQSHGGYRFRLEKKELME